jgi:predicted RNA methylase
MNFKALVLIKYFENVEEFPLNYFRGKRIIELGAGTGAVGIAIGMLGNFSSFYVNWNTT